MRIYLASRFGRQSELRSYRDQLVALGHVVTSRWLDSEHQAGDHGNEGTVAERCEFAEVDSEDIQDADCFVTFTEAPTAAPARGGRHVEFGLALAHAMPVVVVGHRENVFHCLPEVMFAETWREALVHIAEVSRVIDSPRPMPATMGALEREAARGVTEGRPVVIVSERAP